MDRTERGLLLVEREETEKQVQAIRNRLTGMGRLLTEFGNSVTNQPERIVFTNAPEPFGQHTIELFGAPTTDWNSIPDKQTIASLIHEMRALATKLQNLNIKLNS